jgi:RNA polymerase sigma-70 factor (ECF subfamily)
VRKNSNALKTDVEIVRKYLDGDQTAVDDTSEKYGSYIYSVCFGLLRDRTACEECVNAVLSEAWRKIPTDRPENLRIYLCMIARSVSIDIFRKDHRKRRINAGMVDALDDYGDLFEDDYDVSEKLQAKEIAAALNGFLASLPERERACFVKRYYFAKTIKEISKETCIPKSTVYDILGKTREKAAQLLKEKGY